MQHQLAVTGKQAADVAVLLCGQKLAVHRIHRDDELIARLIELETQFWQYVVSDTPPPADGSESADKALRCLYPKDIGVTIDFTSDRALSAAFSDLQSVRQQLDTLERTEALLKQQLQQAMGDATKAIFETGEVSWRRSKDGSSVDMKRLRADYPELLERYAVDKPGSRRFTVLA